MTRDEIYEHLAQVYLGKKNKFDKKQQKQFNAWLVINIVITVIIFASATYGLTAFLVNRDDVLQNRIIYSLNNGPIRIPYNVGYPHPSVKAFSLSVPDVNAAKYASLQFMIRGLEEGYPGTVRIEVRNTKNETASVFVEEVGLHWKNVNVPLNQFKDISDWSGVAEVSFIFESWNMDKKKGIVLIDNICFSS